MGLNLSLLVFQKDNNQTQQAFTNSILKELSFEISEVNSNLSFQEMFEEVYHDFSGKVLAVSSKEDYVIIIDQNNSLITYERPKFLEEHTLREKSCIYYMMNGDTAGVYMYSFLKNGKTLRAVSWNEDGKEELGKELKFEKDGKSPFLVLKNYAFSYEEFELQKWDIVKIIDLITK